jgi:SpoVK/Ycf46/Vps4 family AAA+-type ATPase
MVRAEVIEGLLRAFAERDDQKFRQFANELVDDEQRIKHHNLATRLRSLMDQIEVGSATTKRHGAQQEVPKDPETGFALMHVRPSSMTLEDVILPAESKAQLERIVVEHRNAFALGRFGLRPKRVLLFCGPPGTGKTLSAQALAGELNLPLGMVRFDSIVSSYLGHTAANLRRIFQFLHTFHGVVLFDEVDFIAKRRDDPAEHGEIKRVVNNFMMMLDGYGGPGLLCAATNHQGLLDEGVWRRFDDVVVFSVPDAAARRRLFEKYLGAYRYVDELDYDILVRQSDGFSGADISQACEESIRRLILAGSKFLRTRNVQEAIADHEKRRVVAGK